MNVRLNRSSELNGVEFFELDWRYALRLGWFSYIECIGLIRVKDIKLDKIMLLKLCEEPHKYTKYILTTITTMIRIIVVDTVFIRCSSYLTLALPHTYHILNSRRYKIEYINYKLENRK